MSRNKIKAMGKIKVKLLVVAVVLTIVGFGFSGCKKCYECAYLKGSFKCYKNTDTVYLAIVSPKSINDTLGYYLSSGYSCDTFYLFYAPNAFYGNPVCTNKGYKNAIEEGAQCQEEK